MNKDYEVSAKVDLIDIDKCYLNMNPELEKMIREIHAMLLEITRM